MTQAMDNSNMIKNNIEQ